MLYFQLEVDYYSNEINKSKYQNFQLMTSTKINFKDSRKVDWTGCYLATATYHALLLGLKITKSAKYFFQVQVMFVLERYKSLYIHVNTIHVSKNHHCYSQYDEGLQGSPLLSTNVGVSPLYRLVVAS